MTQLLLLPTLIAAPVPAGDGKAGSSLAAVPQSADLAAEGSDASALFSNLLAGGAQQQSIAELSLSIGDLEADPLITPLPLQLNTDPEAVVVKEINAGVQALLQTDIPELLEELPVISVTTEEPAPPKPTSDQPSLIEAAVNQAPIIADQPIIIPQDTAEGPFEQIELEASQAAPVTGQEIPADEIDALLIPEDQAAPAIATDFLDGTASQADPSLKQPVLAAPEFAVEPAITASEAIELPITRTEAPLVTDSTHMAEDLLPGAPTDTIAAPLPVGGETLATGLKPAEQPPARPNGQQSATNPAGPVDANAGQDPEQPLPATNQPAADRQVGDERRLNQSTQANQTVAAATKSLTQGDGKAGQQGDERSGQHSQTPTNLIDLGADTSSRNTERTGRQSFANALLNAGQSAHLESEFDELPARLRIAAANGIERLTVSLRPAALGAMEVHFDTAEDGALRANFVIQRPETLDLLQRDSRALERALGDAGLNVDKDSLNFSLSDQGGREGRFGQDDELADNFGGQPNDQGAGESTDTEILSDIPLDTAAIIEAGRVDVRI